jgi:hypothetical protein
MGFVSLAANSLLQVNDKRVWPDHCTWLSNRIVWLRGTGGRNQALIYLIELFDWGGRNQALISSNCLIEGGETKRWSDRIVWLRQKREPMVVFIFLDCYTNDAAGGIIKINQNLISQSA